MRSGRSLRVCSVGFVTTDSGTGIVHRRRRSVRTTSISGLFAERRSVGGKGYAPRLAVPRCPGRHVHGEFPQCRGRWVKDCDRDIIRDLKSRGLLLHQEQCVHDYPFCWRAEEDPLIQYPRRELVHPHHRGEGEDAGQQPANRLAAGAHPRRPLRQLPGDQRRLGPLAGTLLGHAAADLGLRSRPATRRRWPAMRSCGQAGRAGARSLAAGQAG